MTQLSSVEGHIILGLFAIVMFSSVLLLNKTETSLDAFLLADRKLGVWRGALSMAVSWIWAPAIFICSLQAYTKGLAGIFWFTIPNIVCFFVFAPFALRLRKMLPDGYTLLEFIQKRYSHDVLAHLSLLLVFFGYQLGAIVTNSLAGGLLLEAVSGVDFSVAAVSMSLIALFYSLISGLKASILTDVIQMTVVLVSAFLLVPLCFGESSSITYLVDGLGGVDGQYSNLFHPVVAFTMGIPMTVALLAGPFADQMFYQRAFAVKKEALTKTFIYAGLIFGLVPILLSLLGFVGAGMARAGALEVVDPQMVGPAVIAALLPKVALYAFCLMAFAGLCSTMDSSFCAISAIGSIDIYRRYIDPSASKEKIVRASRFCMIFLAVLGTMISLLKPKMLWVFLVYGAMAPAGLFPIVFSVYSKKVTAKVIAIAVLLSLGLGTPLSIYANVTEQSTLIVVSSLISVGVGLVVCLVGHFLSDAKN